MATPITPITWTLVDPTPPAAPVVEQTPAQSAGAVVPRDLKLDEDGDLVFEAGDLVFTSGADAVRQDAECRIRFIKNEWFLSRESGVEYHEAIFVKAPDLARIRAIYTRELLATPGITTVLDVTLELDKTTRRLTGSFRATGDLGEIAGTVGGAA